MTFLLQTFKKCVSLLSKALFASPTATSQDLYPLLLLGDTFYYMYCLIFFSITYFYQNLISLLLSLIAIVLYYLLGGFKGIHLDPKKNQLQRYIFIAFNFLHMIIGFDYPKHFNHNDYFPRLQAESLWRFLILDCLACNFFTKLVFGIFCLQVYLCWKFPFDIRLLCTLTSLLVINSVFKGKAKKRKGGKPQSVSNEFQEIKFSKRINDMQNVLVFRRPKDRSLTESKHVEKDNKLLAKILNQMPEGVIVLDASGRVRYMNNYMKNIFEFEEGISLQQLSQNLSKFEFKEATIQLSAGIRSYKKSSSGHFEEDGIGDPIMSESNKLTKEEFLKKVQKISSLQDLFNSCMEEPEVREASSKYVPTFQTRYSHQHDNESFSMEVKAHLLIENLHERYLIILWRDTTERENKIICLEEEQANFRNNILASFSHELRTPLNANLAFLEQSMDTAEIPHKIKEQLIKPAWISGKLLFFLIKDILDYSQMLLNKLDLHIESRSIIQTVHQCLELFQEKILQKRLLLNLNIDKNIPPVVFTDHDRFSQVLINLLSNAVKFTFHGSIDISIAITPQSTLLISVKDTGVGMEERSQEKLKRKLAGEAISGRISGDSVGIGVGSFIANKLAIKLSPKEKIGLEFLSEKGKGSFFYFEVENKKPKDEVSFGFTITADFMHQLDTDEKCTAVRSIQGHQTLLLKNSFKLNGRNGAVNTGHVLIVDDEIFNIIVIENFCKAFGIKVEKAFHGEEAINKLRLNAEKNEKNPISIVFMDINMPVMDGYQASFKIQDLVRRKQIPPVIVVGVTAYVADEMISKCYRSGMSEVLNKPVSKEVLVGVLRKYNMVE